MAPGGNTAALDRHLKKIYDCLNIGCNKKAVQEVDRLPKNVKDLTVFRALKSLALIRMYKRHQAFEILDEINPEQDLDEITLQTMTSCYKESADVARIVDLYEAASRRKPNEPEILAHLFMAHARVFNFKRQKEIALQMYKSFPQKKRLYSFWAIMSLVMQSQEAKKQQDSTDARVCLSLAEKMCEKMIDDERTNEEIELYLMILRKQNKHEEEYRFLTGPICLRITDHLSWFNRRRAYLCLDLKMYSRAFKHYFPTLIQEYPDQIEYYQGLFKSAFLLDTEALSQQLVAISDQQTPTAPQPAGTPVKSASALAECYDIVERQCILALENVEPTKDQQKNKSQQGAKSLSRTSSLNPNRKRLLRGPFMAKIELYHTILSNESVIPKNVFNICKSQFATKYPTLVSLLLDYFQSFSKKLICFYDLQYMIARCKLSEAEKISLVESAADWLSSTSRSEMSALDVFHITLNYHMLKHLVHDHKVTDSREDRLKMAQQFIKLYDDNRQLGKTTNKTEFQPVDDYCLLAVNSIMTNAVDLDDLTNQTIINDSVLISLIVMVENAIANSSSNHHLKLTLLKLYSFVGASKQCSDVLLTLDIKHFQIDTLGHLLNPVLYNTGNYSLSKDSLETCLEFYAHGVRECFEGLTSCYRDGRFSKIEEISSVLKRLCDSLNASQCVLLRGIVAYTSASTLDEIKSASHSFDPFKGVHGVFRCGNNTDTIRDSRDFKVLKSFHAETSELIQKRQVENLEDERLWLKLRYHLLKSVCAQLTHLPEPCGKKGGKCDHLAELNRCKEVVEDLKPKFQLSSTESTDKRHSYFEPESSPFRWRHINFEALISLVTQMVFLPSSSSISTSVQDSYGTNLDAIINELEEQLKSIDSLVRMKQALLSLTISIEFISLCITSLVSIACMSSASPATANSSHQSGGNSVKTSSSHQQQQAPTKLKSIPQQMINKTEAQLTRLANLVKGVDPKTCILDKVTCLEEILQSDSEQTRTESKCGSVSIPLMGQEVSLRTKSVQHDMRMYERLSIYNCPTLILFLLSILSPVTNSCFQITDTGSQSQFLHTTVQSMQPKTSSHR